MRILHHLPQSIPNFLSLLNLLCGCIAIVKVFEKNISEVMCFLTLGLIFDFLDGAVARLLNARSDLGKQLDSLADVVTFGVLPGFVIFSTISEVSDHTVLPYVGFLIPVFSALRLGMFNATSTGSMHFIGLPTPANATLICSTAFALAITKTNDSCEVIRTLHALRNPYFFSTLSVICSALLVAPIRFFSLKFSHFKWRGNELRYITIALAPMAFFTLEIWGVPFIMVFYILICVLFFQKK